MSISVVAIKDLCDTTWNFECFVFAVFVNLGVLIDKSWWHQLDVRNWCFGFCLTVESGNTKLNGIDVTGYWNASSRFISSPNITPNACLSSFMTKTALRIFFRTFDLQFCLFHSNFQQLFSGNLFLVAKSARNYCFVKF